MSKQEQVQIQATKPANKGKGRTQRKPTPPAAAQETQAAAPLTLAYRLDGRTAGQLSGARLYAHTRAFFDVTQAWDGRELPMFIKILGTTAYAWHKKQRRLEIGPQGSPRLTQIGVDYFKNRGVEQNLVDSYTKAFTTGEIPEGLSKFPMLKI